MYYVNTSVSLPSFYSRYMFRLLMKPSSGCKTFLVEAVMYAGAIKLFKVRISDHHISYLYIYHRRGRDNSVGIATRYGLQVRDRVPVRTRFSVPIQTVPGANPASSTMGTGSLPGVKRLGRAVDHPPYLAPRLKRESRAMPLLPLCVFMACYRVNFPFFISMYHSIDCQNRNVWRKIPTNFMICSL